MVPNPKVEGPVVEVPPGSNMQCPAEPSSWRGKTVLSP